MTVETTGQPSETSVAPPITAGDVDAAQVSQEQATKPTPDAGAEGEKQADTRTYTREEAERFAEKRIKQLQRDKTTLDNRINAFAREVQEAEARYAQLWQQHQELARRSTRPSLNQFQTVEEYERATREHDERYLAEQRQAEAERQQRVQFAQQAYQREVALATKIAEAQAKYDDFQEVVNNPALPSLRSLHPAVMDALVADPAFAEISYYFGKNVAEAHKVAALHPALAIKELGRIAAQVAKPPKQISNAPEPPATVGGTKAAPAKSVYDPNISQDDYEKLRREQRRRGR